jgi:hypothetical protein
MADIADIAHYVRLETPGVMDTIIVQTIAAVAMDFCERTRAWDEIQDPIALVDGVRQYDMEGPGGESRVLSIGQVWSATRALESITMRDLARVLPTWQTVTAPLPIYYNAAIDRQAITVFPTPLDAQGALLTFRAQYAPKRTATTLPAFLLERHLDALVAGAKARLFSQVNVPWSSAAFAAMHAQAYEQAVVNARIEQLHDRVPGTLRVAPRRFF